MRCLRTLMEALGSITIIAMVMCHLQVLSTSTNQVHKEPVTFWLI